MADIKISQLTAKGTLIASTDLIEISESNGAGGYVTKSVTGANIIGSKQDTLVSGTNIKTLNSNSILGSGDLAVQPTLISGTNIKTIEGQSILGGGNINITNNDVGLGNVDDTSDLNKPISTATQTALNAKQNTITNSDSITQGATNLFLTTAERTKLTNTSGTNTGDQTNITGNAATVTTNANLTGVVTSTGNTTAIADNALSIAKTSGLQGAIDLKQDLSSKNAANGYAGLDASSKINPSQLPSIAITDTFVVINQAAQLALTAEVGDVAVRTDLNKSFILKTSPATTFANWQELLTPTDSVSSVFGRTGVVTAQNGDYTASQVGAPSGSGTSTGTNTGDNATNSQYSGLVSNATHTGDATGNIGLTVKGINGTILSTLTTGILKNTTGTGVPSIAVAADFPILNQNTTGTAGSTATLATARTISTNGDVAYTSPPFDGSANVLGTATLASIGVAGTYTKVTTDAKGRVTVGANLTAGDVPTLNQNTTGTAANVTGIVPVANGGTGTATPSLVAGTNITITGSFPNQTITAAGGGGGGGVTQILAGTNVTISPAGGTGVVTVNASGGGGGTAGGPHLITQGLFGWAYGLKTNSKANTTCTTATNRMTLMPFVPNTDFLKTRLLDTFGFYINVITASAVNCKVVVFSDSGGLPLTKLFEGATMSCSTTGVKVNGSSFGGFSKGTKYWIGTITSGAGPTLTQYSPDSMIPILEYVGTESKWFWSTTSYTYASVPATVAGNLFIPESTNCPAVFFSIFNDE
jgi:hypothetical protein